MGLRVVTCTFIIATATAAGFEPRPSGDMIQLNICYISLKTVIKRLSGSRTRNAHDAWREDGDVLRKRHRESVKLNS